MALFRRKRGAEGDLDLAGDDQGVTAPAEDAEPSLEGATSATEPVRSGGPWDQAQAPDDGQARLDFGALRIPGFPDMELRLDLDRDTERVIAATAVAHGGRLQIQAFAAPRSGALWPEVRAELVSGIRAAGGTVTEGVGAFGTELVAQVPGEDGSPGLQPARFVGTDGARWFLRGVFSGAAAAPGESATLLESVFAGTIVVRGDQAMAPRDLLTLTLPHLPTSPPPPAVEEGQREPLQPFRRGPEITEIR